CRSTCRHAGSRIALFTASRSVSVSEPTQRSSTVWVVFGAGGAARRDDSDTMPPLSDLGLITPEYAVLSYTRPAVPRVDDACGGARSGRRPQGSFVRLTLKRYAESYRG